MNSGHNRQNRGDVPRGLSPGRNWTDGPADEHPLTWTLDPSCGLVQGPLDLGFMRGQKLALALEPGQLALLVQDDEVRAVFLDGVHRLDIGTGQRQVSPACRLTFLAPGEGLQLSWSAAAPLRWGPGVDQALIGTCRLRIDAPVEFHRTFLAGAKATDDTFLIGLIEQILRGLFEDMLGSDGDLTPTFADVQAHLARLTPEDLDDELAPYGLACRHLAVYTAGPPVGDEHHQPAAEHDIDDVQMSGHFDGIGHN